MVQWYLIFDLSSKHTSLHPVLNPGSKAMIRLGPNGDAISNWLKFLEKIVMASRSAFSLASPLISVSMLGAISRFKESFIASLICSAAAPLDFINLWFNFCYTTSF